MRDVAIVGANMLKFGRDPDKDVVTLAAEAAIGATGVPVINVSNACATGSTAFREAYYSVASGAYDVAMAIGSEQMGKMGLLGAGGGGDRAYNTEGGMGTGLMPGVFGQSGVEHMRQYGTTQAQFAKIAVKNHEHGVLNPYAQYRTETPLA